MVVPDEQQATAHVGVPGPGAGQTRGALGVGNELALAVTAPAPVVERAGHLVALDGSLRQIAAHVPAVAVEDLQVALRIGEHHQLGAEYLDRVRLTVKEVLDRSQAVPAPRIAVWQGAGVDLSDAGMLR